MQDAGHAAPVPFWDPSPIHGLLPLILAKRVNPDMDSEEVQRVFTAAMATHDEVLRRMGQM